VKILVAVKRVPDPGLNVKVKPGVGVALEGVNFVVNPFDEIAIEEALLIKEKKVGSGEVVVFSIGPKDAQQQLRTAMAMGADRGILVAGEDGALDSDIVARTLVKVFEKEKPDLVLLGKQTTDHEANQVGQLLAEYLDLGQATFASKVEVAADKTHLIVDREVDGGIETVQVKLPAVVTADLRLNTPRYASLPGIMKAKKKPLEETTFAALGVEAKPKVRTLAVTAPPERKAGVKVESVQDLVGRLKNEAKVL
jgi:electron transfer flavoprotein beta subunit